MNFLGGLKNIGNVAKTGLDKVKTGIENAQNRYDKLSDSQKKFANSLFTSNMPQNTEYNFTPTMVDYSEYMGLSPEAQRYLYRGM